MSLFNRNSRNRGRRGQPPAPPAQPGPPSSGAPPRPPGAGRVSPVPESTGPAGPQEPPPAPAPSPEPAPRGESEVYEVLARFTTAAGALAFAEQAMQSAQADDVPCYRDEAGLGWWIRTRGVLGPVREMAGLGAPDLYVQAGHGFVRDRGWGDILGPATELPVLAPVSLLELVRVAGLHPAPARPVREACVLLPGYLVPGLLQRALDLRLSVTYQRVQLDPLFAADGTAAPARFSYAVRLTASPDQARRPARPGEAARAAELATLPQTLLAALRDDPFALVCREAGRSLLIGYGTASPLSDRALARMVAASGDSTWLLAGAPGGCARVTWIGEPLDAANFVRLGPAYALADVGETQAYAEATKAPGLRPRVLRLVAATARTSVTVDAMLLDDADLECLPTLLAGEPLGDIAFLIRGRSRHLLSAPGGLLTELAVGEPLTCVGPGSIYLPTGYRLDPPVGPAARAALFQPDESLAQVVLRDTRLVYELAASEPAWRLWAGPVPAIDPQLPLSASADLDLVAAEVGEPPQPKAAQKLSSPKYPLPPPVAPSQDPSAWLEQARQAELARDYATAAQLFARHNEPLRAARMWEREAEEKSDAAR